MHKNYIAVTGSAGFIGFSLSMQLLKEGYNVIGIDNFNNYYLTDLKEARAELLKKVFKLYRKNALI